LTFFKFSIISLSNLSILIKKAAQVKEVIKKMDD